MQLPGFLGTSPCETHPPVSFLSCMTLADLHHYIPENSAGYILAWFQTNPVHLRVTKSRSSKFGDYRAPDKHVPARISVNHNLNKYDFLITLVHEMAHHEVWIESITPVSGIGILKRKRRFAPHGKEWKNHYRLLMSPLLSASVFPPDLIHHLEKEMENLRSSSRANENLVIALKKYDEPDGSVFIESLPFDAIFTLPAGRTFRKQQKLRKRYRCICLDNGRIYLFSPLARVVPEST